MKLLILLGALALAACGGGGDDAPRTADASQTFTVSAATEGTVDFSATFHADAGTYVEGKFVVLVDGQDFFPAAPVIHVDVPDQTVTETISFPFTPGKHVIEISVKITGGFGDATDGKVTIDAPACPLACS